MTPTTRLFPSEPAYDGIPRLFSLDTGRTDYLCPFLGIVDNELAEISGRACKRLRAQIGKPGLEFGIGKPGIDRTIELVDDSSSIELSKPHLTEDSLRCSHRV
jgi:hypothetical protein